MLRSLAILSMLGCMAPSPTPPTPTGALAELDYFETWTAYSIETLRRERH